LHVKRHADHTPLQQNKQRIRFAAFPSQEKGRFSKDWLARQQWWAKDLPLFACPRMVPQTGGEKTYQGAGVEQARTFFLLAKTFHVLRIVSQIFGHPFDRTGQVVRQVVARDSAGQRLSILCLFIHSRKQLIRHLH
jgi:hypothetical protein